ncbi:MAG: transposase [Methanoregula sp.]|nr:transposase [Methanoregula sp.]
MNVIPVPVQNTLNKMKKILQHNVEIHVINGGFYVYRASSIYDKEKKKPRKTTEYIGSISKDGTFKQKKELTTLPISRREIFEYANGALAYECIKDVEVRLKEYTPFYRELIAFSLVKVLDPKPIRLISSRWEKLDLSKYYDVNLSPKHLGEVLHAIGSEVSWWYALFADLATNDDLIFYDLTAIMTYSDSIKLAEKGYNAQKDKHDQIGVSIAFSTANNLPIGCEVSYGSERDIKTIKNFLARFPKNNLGLILDRGFSSITLIQKLQGRGIRYLVPLKKNSTLISQPPFQWDNAFFYRDRPIMYAVSPTEHGTLYLFKDPLLKGEREATLLKKVIKKGFNYQEYEKQCELTGIIPLLSNLKMTPPEIFLHYKEREDVELAFEVLKNAIDSDKTYLQSPESVRGYFFISLLALRIYFKILKKLRILNLNQIISVEEVFFELSKVEMIYDSNNRKSLAQIPKRAADIFCYFESDIPMG